MIWGKGGVGDAAQQLDVIALRNPLGLLLDGQDSLTLPVSIWQSGLELVMVWDQAFNLLDGMDKEQVLQVLHGTLHPVVEGCGPLGLLQM